MSESTRSTPQWIDDHIKLYSEDPEKAHMWDSAMAGGTGIFPVLLLTAKGRKSGQPKSLPLIYKKVGKNYVIVASKGGAPAHPAWYLNLLSEANCHIQVAHDHFDGVARTATGSERDGLWEQLAQVYPPYNDYKKYAEGREIPVVVVEPQ